MKKRKKNMFTLLVLCGVLLLGIGLYFIVPKGESEDEKGETEETSITVDTIDTEQVVEIEVQKSGKTAYHLTKEKKTWKFADDKSLPVDEDRISTLLDSVANVTATKEMEAAGDRSDYGIENPVLTICIRTEDKTYQYKLGNEVPVEGGVYGISSDSEKIFCMSDSLLSTFDVEANSLIQKDTIPDITEDDMTAVKIVNKKGRDFEAKAVRKSHRVESNIKWNITKPYEKPLPVSDENWSTTLGYFTSLEFGELVEYGAKNPAQYGLDHPSSVITVKYKKEKKEKSFVLYVGKQKEDNYYVCLKGSSNIYLLSSGEVEQLTKLDAYDCMNKKVYNNLVTEIKGYDVIYGDKTLKVTSSLKKEKTEDSEEDSLDASNYIWSLNGKTIPDDDVTSFVSPYSTVREIEYTGKVDKKVKPKSDEPVLKMIYHEENRDVTVTFTPYDGTNFYRVNRDGMDYFLVDKKAVDESVKRFQSIEKMGK